MDTNIIPPPPFEHPPRAEAEEFLEMSHAANPGPWVAHSRVAARAAEIIAAACGIDVDAAYTFGLLHDIGRFEGSPGMHYTIAGYELMQKMGYPNAAQICITHAFPYSSISDYEGCLPGCTYEETVFIISFLQHAQITEYDQLIQLCDALSSPQGACLLESRFVETARRHGFDAYTLKRWEATLALKALFDQRCGCNIYTLFGDEILANSFR